MKSRHRAHVTLLGLSFLLLEMAMAWAQSETELIRGAKQDGKVMFWSAMRNEDNQALVEGFEAK